MAADLLSVLLQFQPESAEVKHKRDYDQQARNFVSQLSNISAAHWQKGADTPQDVLKVCIRC
jgi:COP9 signalosome complex subunit 3